MNPNTGWRVRLWVLSLCFSVILPRIGPVPLISQLCAVTQTSYNCLSSPNSLLCPRQITKPHNISCTTFSQRHILRVFHLLGKVGRPGGRLTHWKQFLLSAQGCVSASTDFLRLFCCKYSFERRSGLEGSAIYGFCMDLRKALDVVMRKSRDVKPSSWLTLNRNLVGPKCGQPGTV